MCSSKCKDYENKWHWQGWDMYELVCEAHSVMELFPFYSGLCMSYLPYFSRLRGEATFVAA